MIPQDQYILHLDSHLLKLGRPISISIVGTVILTQWPFARQKATLVSNFEIGKVERCFDSRL